MTKVHQLAYRRAFFSVLVFPAILTLIHCSDAGEDNKSNTTKGLPSPVSKTGTDMAINEVALPNPREPQPLPGQGSSQDSNTPMPPTAPTTNRWLQVKRVPITLPREGTIQVPRITRPDGSIWRGRGITLHDTRSCDACTVSPPVPEIISSRANVLVNDWNVNFIRLLLESYPQQRGATADRHPQQWQSILDDENYFNMIVNQVRAMGQLGPDVYVLVSLWRDASIDEKAMGWPTLGPGKTTEAVWRKLAAAFAQDSHVMFGIVNEPQKNFDGSRDGEVQSLMNQMVAAIRDAEKKAGAPNPHIIAVQGTRQWSRYINHYVSNPITADGGNNVVYESHPYFGREEFTGALLNPSRNLPVILGEFGPFTESMSENEAIELMNLAETWGFPFVLWTFHHNCSGGGGQLNLIEDRRAESVTRNSCSPTMPLVPRSPWGVRAKNYLAEKKGRP